jgi:membrane protease subunit HflC
MQKVVFLDRRIQTLDSPSASPIQTAEKNSLVLDWLVKWRITDPLQFIRNNGTDLSMAETRLSPIVQSALSDEVAKRTVRAVLATERDQVMQGVMQRLAEDAKGFGIEVVDVRVKRVDFPSSIVDRVYRRMESERNRVATQLRALGEAEGNNIRADADRQREVIVAEAYRDAQKVMGDGDAKAAAIYAEAFGKDPQFARFFRNLQAYGTTFRGKSDVLVIDPATNEFFSALRGPDAVPAARGKR